MGLRTFVGALAVVQASAGCEGDPACCSWVKLRAVSLKGCDSMDRFGSSFCLFTEPSSGVAGRFGGSESLDYTSVKPLDSLAQCELCGPTGYTLDEVTDSHDPGWDIEGSETGSLILPNTGLEISFKDIGGSGYLSGKGMGSIQCQPMRAGQAYIDVCNSSGFRCQGFVLDLRCTTPDEPGSSVPGLTVPTDVPTEASAMCFAFTNLDELYGVDSSASKCAPGTSRCQVVCKAGLVPAVGWWQDHHPELESLTAVCTTPPDWGPASEGAIYCISGEKGLHPPASPSMLPVVIPCAVGGGVACLCVVVGLVLVLRRRRGIAHPKLMTLMESLELEPDPDSAPAASPLPPSRPEGPPQLRTGTDARTEACSAFTAVPTSTGASRHSSADRPDNSPAQQDPGLGEMMMPNMLCVADAGLDETYRGNSL
eukprot:gene3288-3793_t